MERQEPIESLDDDSIRASLSPSMNRITFALAALVATLLTAPCSAAAQILADTVTAPVAEAYHKIVAAHPEAQMMYAAQDSVALRSDPRPDAQVVAWHPEGRPFLVYNVFGSWAAVARPREGHAGYVLLSDLRSAEVINTAAVAAPQPVAAYKDPGLATLLSVLIVGGGQFYTGDVAKGLALLGTSSLGLTVGYVMSANSIEAECRSTSTRVRCEDRTNWAPFVIGAAVATGAWLTGIADAGPSAMRANARNGINVRPGLYTAGDAIRPMLTMRLQW